MKKRLLVCAALLLCAGLLLAGCAGVAETPEEAVLTPTQSPAPTQEPVSPAPSMPSPAESAKSPLARIEEQKEAMKAFLLEHQTEMDMSMTFAKKQCLCIIPITIEQKHFTQITPSSIKPVYWMIPSSTMYM